MIVVAKVGTSSITSESGEIDEDAIAKFCREVVALRQVGHRVVMVIQCSCYPVLPRAMLRLAHSGPT